MCGIVGIIKFDKEKVNELDLRNMMLSIKHRGPDDEGVFISHDVGLGFVRLSIIDLSKSGHQPMISDDGKFVVIFNGEIFNYLEIKEELILAGVNFITNSDTEVLLKAYLKWGEACLDKFNGMWAFVIYNIEQRTFFASRDRFGIKPFYYLQNKDFFAFSSEIQPLLKLVAGKPNANYDVIYDYLVYNRTDQTENTFFKEIKKLQHGCNLKISANQVTINKWYDLSSSVLKNSGISSSKDFLNLFKDSVLLRLRSDVPIGVCLSGGIDSSSITSILIKSDLIRNLNSFSAVFGDNKKADESKYIRAFQNDVANMNFIEPNSKSFYNDINNILDCHAEPFPGTSPYAQYKVMQLACGKVKVTLDGQGADEMLAGYSDFYGYYFKELFLHFKLNKLLKEIYQYYKIHKSFYAIRAFFYFILPTSIKSWIRVNQSSYMSKVFINDYKDSSLIAKTLLSSKTLREALLNHFEYKLEHLLKWEDINSMAFSIEARVPFLDHRLVESVIASESSLIINKGVSKFLLRDSMKGLLPKIIEERVNKIGFITPEDEWFREEPLKSYVNDILTSESIKNRGIFNIRELIKMYENHMSGKVNKAKEIWKCVHLELWFRKYIDRSY